MRKKVIKSLEEMEKTPLVVISVVIVAIGAYKSVTGDSLGGHVMVAGVSFFIGTIMGRILK